MQCDCEPDLCIHAVYHAPPGSPPEVVARYAERNRLNAALRITAGETGFCAVTNRPVPKVSQPPKPTAREYILATTGPVFVVFLS